MQGPPRGDEAIQGLDAYEQLVDNFAQQAKAYWRLWGPLGELMVRGMEAWAEGQRAYLQWLRAIEGLMPSKLMLESSVVFVPLFLGILKKALCPRGE